MIFSGGWGECGTLDVAGGTIFGDIPTLLSDGEENLKKKKNEKCLNGTGAKFFSKLRSKSSIFSSK